MIFFLGSLAVLILGAEFAGRGLEKVSLALGVAPLFLGLTLASIMTDLPEIVLSVVSSAKASLGVNLSEFIFSNALGSVFFQGTLAVGILGLLRKFEFSKRISIDAFAAMLAGILLLILSLDGTLSRIDGLLLIAFEVAYLRNVFSSVRKESPARPDFSALSEVFLGLMFFVSGVIMIIASSDVVVNEAMRVSASLGISELAIGLIAGFGTSLPEIVFSVSALLKGMHGAAVGNLVGSNTVDLTLPLGFAALINPLAVSLRLVFFGLAVGVLDFVLLRNGKMGRAKAAVFLAASIPFFLFIG